MHFTPVILDLPAKLCGQTLKGGWKWQRRTQWFENAAAIHPGLVLANLTPKLETQVYPAPIVSMKGDMPDRKAIQDREVLRRWVETWRRAGPELEEIRRREIESIDTREAIRQLFGSEPVFQNIPPRETSGLIEQQTWFAKLRQ